MTDENPPPRRARAPGQREELVTITVALETITPILGGAAAPRELDEHDPIRVPGIRGQLRFWWRALHGHGKTATELAREEAAIWGGVHGEAPARSRVAVWIASVDRGTMVRDKEKPDFRALYALWPADNKNKELIAHRWRPGIRFELALRLPIALREPVERTLRAWILFGGVGARTRRGCGSVTVQESDRQNWLPREPSLAALRRLLGDHVFVSSTREATDMPLLHAAILLHGRTERDGEKVWHQALKWLSDFRQEPGPPGTPSRFAREPIKVSRRPGNNARRAGRSRWPEPDKIRHLLAAGYPNHPGWPHVPVYNEKPVWPRASFGLPINGRFQGKDIEGNAYSPADPEAFELYWQDASRSYDRLASPLILKPLPLANGSYVPTALWLQRGYPTNGTIMLRVAKRVRSRVEKEVVQGSEAPFDRLRAHGDVVLYKPLEKEQPMRDAFVTWLETERKLTKLGGGSV